MKHPLTGLVLWFVVAVATASCGGSSANSSSPPGDDGGGQDGTTNSDSSGSSSGSDAASDATAPDSGAAPCPAGATCNVTCGGGVTTTIRGTVFDPAGRNPLYNVVAYVPAGQVQALPTGVPTGAAACSCGALITGNPTVSARTDTSGNFTIENAPVGQNIPLVIQIGKWRVQTKVNVTQCTSNSAGMIILPRNGTEGDIPNIAVSTGSDDSLECILRRIGLDAAEYVPGASTSGHVHIFNGGVAENHGEVQPMPGAPASYASGGLCDTVDDLMMNDIVLLSCEGAVTESPNPSALETYLNQGGGVIGSHFHYAWFAPSPIGSAPADWGDNLASWQANSVSPPSTLGSVVDTTLTAGGTFAKGVAFQQWLTTVNALGQMVGGTTVPAGELAIAQARFNASVTTQTASQAWLQADGNAGAGNYPTVAFSFDTPVSPPSVDGGGAGLLRWSRVHRRPRERGVV